MKYRDITLKKYQIIKHVINKYAENHDSVKPHISYDKDTQILDISGISKPINFNTGSIGIVPEGAYEVVGQVIRSKTSEGYVDAQGMNAYKSASRIFNIANDNRQEVFDFIDKNSTSAYCSCCGTTRDRNKLFYIRNLDSNHDIYQVGSRCITEYFDTSYFDLMKEIDNVIENTDISAIYQFADYNLIDYLTLYCIFIKNIRNTRSCCNKVIEILDSCEDVTKTSISDEFILQKDENINKILSIAKFYTEYPDYVRDDNLYIIKTIQSMADMLNGNIDADPYYSKSNCSNIAKMYISLLQNYASDYRKFKRDLFKYNAYLVENSLSDIWNIENRTEYKLRFELDKQSFNISIINIDIPSLKSVKILVSLTDEGNMIDEGKAKSAIISLASELYKSINIESNRQSIVDILSSYKNECIARYSHFKPFIMFEYGETSVTFLDYSNEPLVLSINSVIDDIEEAKSKLSAFINLSYTRQKLNSAYKDFSKKYTGTQAMAYTQPLRLNRQFSREYLEVQFKANWPKNIPLTISSYIENSNKNVIIQYNQAASKLKMPLNNIGILSGSDNDIAIRIQTFIAKELNLPMPTVKKERTHKSEEEKLKLRPKKNVTRAFSDAGVSARNLVMISKVNVLNDLSSKSLGLAVSKIGKILFKLENNNVVRESDTYYGRISLDGHNITAQKTFDKKTLVNAVHALEYLVYLSDTDNNLLCNTVTLSTKNGINHIYKYDLQCGNCIGSLQFKLVQIKENWILKSSPRFVVESVIDGHKVTCMININFSEECWKNIQNGILQLNDIQRGSSILNGQKNNNIISGTMWIDNGETQKLSNEIFTKVTGLTVT